MDLPSTIIVIVLVIGFVIPLTLYYVRTKKREKELRDRFVDIAKSRELNLDIMESWKRMYFIGLDTTQKKLLYHLSEGENIPLMIDLKKVKNVKINKISHEVKSGNEKSQITDHLDLIITFKDGESKERYLEFYDGEKFSVLEGEYPLILKWQDILTKHL